MSKHEDRYGLSLSTASAEAASAYCNGIDLMLSAWTGASESFERAIAVYGWLLERRHGLLPVLALFAVGGIGTAAVTATDATLPLALGANGAALALLVAWAIPDLLSMRRGEEIEGDLLGTAVVAVVVALMPLAAPGASWIGDVVGVLAGTLIGLPLALAGER